MYFLIVLGILTLKILFAHASPASPTLNITAVTHNSLYYPLVGDPTECYHVKFWHSRRARLLDCTRAAAQLPNLHTTGIFRTGGDPRFDPFALPRAEQFGSCEVKISLSHTRQDESTWQAISIGAQKIISACTIGYGVGATTGGETTAGLHQMIHISVRDPERPTPSVITEGMGADAATA